MSLCLPVTCSFVLFACCRQAFFKSALFVLTIHDFCLGNFIFWPSAAFVLVWALQEAPEREG